MYFNLTPWPQSAKELYRASDRRLSAKLVPTFENRRCSVVSEADPYGRNLGLIDRSRYFFFQVAPQLYSRGWVDPVPDPLLLRKSGSAGNRTWTSGPVANNSDHYTKVYILPTSYLTVWSTYIPRQKPPLNKTRITIWCTIIFHTDKRPLPDLGSTIMASNIFTLQITTNS
jgi:hypothetical protein